nr:RimK family alpha-L-glutamate ligase [Candidatus Sigynarchaeota archaeon]
MKLGIIINIVTFEVKELLNAAKKHFPDVQVELFKNDDFKFDITDPKGFNTDVDVFIQRSISMTRAVYTSMIIENFGYRVINSYDCLSKTEDKLVTTQVLRKAGIPTPRTYVAFTKEMALEAMHDLEYPVILKPISGSWGRLIALLENDHAATAVLEDREELGSVYHKIFYIQDYVDKPARTMDQFRCGSVVARDIRAFVVGGEVVGAMQRY